MPLEYDARKHDRYGETQESLRLKLSGAAIVVGVILILVVIDLPFRGPNLSKPGDLALVAMLVVAAGIPRRQCTGTRNRACTRIV